MVTLSFKVTPQEARLIRGGARRERLTVSEYLRQRAAAPVPIPSKPSLERCLQTGALIFKSGKDLSPLTVESTRDLLADFP